ncbi:MAG: VOC family protein [Pseudohongiellaceae bacterium]
MQKLEHIHLDVVSLKNTEAFLQAALPDYGRRGNGYTEGFGHWVHIGAQDNYIALTETKTPPDFKALRHVGFEVDDLEALMGRLRRAGYEPSDDSAVDGHAYRRRVYYKDLNGIHWEFVQYLSDNLAERNQYG